MPDRQSTNDNNPFAPPPEGQPDQPWQPRRPEGPEGQEEPEDGGSSGGPGWSSSQPGRSSDGFGRRPERPSGGQGGPDGGQGGQGPGLRWDPTDPAQRRARYAVLSGMWAFFFAIFDIPEAALLLGALGVYWAVSALRAKVKAPGAGEGGGPQAPAQAGQAGQAGQAAARSKRTAAISGLVASAVALMIVASGFAMHLAYRDFYECRADALTKQSQLACNDLLPKPLQDTFGVRE